MIQASPNYIYKILPHLIKANSTRFFTKRR